jgi:hypothetical protein
MDTLKEKHRTGTNEVDDPDRGPTGPVYRAIEQQQQQQQYAGAAFQKQERLQAQQQKDKRVEELQHKLNQQFGANDDNNDDEDDSDFEDLDDDPILDGIRERRIQAMQQAAGLRAQHLANGHGQYRTIRQDDFLSECTSSGSEFVAVHFFHREFQRCEIMDHHLKIMSFKHTSCKFVRIDAEKAPFFVAKLQIKTLPTLLVFRDGKTTDRLTGFEGLSQDPKDPDKWETRRLQEWLAKTGAIDYTPSKEEIWQEMMSLGVGPKTTVKRGGMNYYNEDN